MTSLLPTAYRLLPTRRRRRGTILVAALWAMIILTGVVLLFARTMRVEAISANNRVSAVQAAAIVRGAEQYVLSLVEGAGGDPTLALDAPGEAAVGEDPYDRRPLGYFWLIKPDPVDPELTAFGLVDENAKIDLGSAPPEELLKLPGMTADVADAIVDWRDPDSDVTDQGAEKEYYMSLPQPYEAKNDRFETVEELRLVKGMTEELLFGWDRNRDGVMDEREQAYGGTATSFNAASGAGRGIAPFVTVYSAEPAAVTGLTDVNGDPQQLQQALARALPPDRTTAVLQQAGVTAGGGGGPQGGGGGGPQPQQRFSSVFEFAARGGMTPQELTQVYDSLTASAAATAAPTTGPVTGGGTARASVVRGRVNLNTAPREVIGCLTGLEQPDVEKLLGARAQAGSSLAWVYELLGPQKAAGVGARLTNRSYQYSADIVAITANGKSFRRVRIVVDGRQTPARIVYRKDVSDLGWPLDEQTRLTLREGGVLETPFGSGGGSSVGR